MINIYLVYGCTEYEGDILQGAYRNKETADTVCETLAMEIEGTGFDYYIVRETELE